MTTGSARQDDVREARVVHGRASDAVVIRAARPAAAAGLSQRQLTAIVGLAGAGWATLFCVAWTILA